MTINDDFVLQNLTIEKLGKKNFYNVIAWIIDYLSFDFDDKITIRNYCTNILKTHFDHEFSYPKANRFYWKIVELNKTYQSNVFSEPWKKRAIEATHLASKLYLALDFDDYNVRAHEIFNIAKRCVALRDKQNDVKFYESLKEIIDSKIEKIVEQKTNDDNVVEYFKFDE